MLRVNPHEIQKPSWNYETVQAMDEPENLEDSRLEREGVVSKHVEMPDSSVNDIVGGERRKINWKRKSKLKVAQPMYWRNREQETRIWDDSAYVLGEAKEVAIQVACKELRDEWEEYTTIFNPLHIQPNETCFGIFSSRNLHIPTQLS